METNVESLGFSSSANRLQDERLSRYEASKDAIKTGNKFLDDMFIGVTKHDLVLVGARTGAGKTEFITSVAAHNARLGKKVYVFALEAEPKEIETRIRFKILSEAYQKAYPGRFITYRDFIWGRYSKEFQELDKDCEVHLQDGYLKNLYTFYRTGEFKISDFEKIFSVIEKSADIVILDHVHFFDYETENENKELTEITKRIRDLALISGKPTFIVGHLRKQSHNSKEALPSIDDFHGSSNLAKIITKGIVIDSGGPTPDGKFVTYFRIVKDRKFGGATRYIGKMIFDPTTNAYEENYKLCVLTDRNTKIAELSEEDYPKWL